MVFETRKPAATRKWSAWRAHEWDQRHREREGLEIQYSGDTFVYTFIIDGGVGNKEGAHTHMQADRCFCRRRLSSGQWVSDTLPPARERAARYRNWGTSEQQKLFLNDESFRIILAPLKIVWLFYKEKCLLGVLDGYFFRLKQVTALK